MLSTKISDEIEFILDYLNNNHLSFENIKNISIYSKEFFIGKILNKISNNENIKEEWVFLARDFIVMIKQYYKYVVKNQDRCDKLDLELKAIEYFIHKNYDENKEYVLIDFDLLDKLNNYIGDDILGYIKIIYNHCINMNVKYSDYFNTMTVFDESCCFERSKKKCIEFMNNNVGFFDISKDLIETSNNNYQLLEILLKNLDNDFFTNMYFIMNIFYDKVFIDEDDERNSLIDLSFSIFFLQFTKDNNIKELDFFK